MNISVPGDQLIVYLLASIRIVCWLIVVPPFSADSVPAQAKVAISLGLAITVAPSVNATSVPTSSAELIVTALTQVLIGLAMGFVTMMLFTVISTAGSLIDLFGGFSLTQAFDPLALNPTSVFGKFHTMIAAVLLFATGGHLLVVGGLLSTFNVLPVGETASITSMQDVVEAVFKMFLVTSVQIALPIIAVMFIADLSLALLTKVAPSLNAISIMMPAKIGLTLVLVGLTFPVLPGATDRLVDMANEAMSALVGG